jgi:cytochrome P450 family 6
MQLKADGDFTMSDCVAQAFFYFPAFEATPTVLYYAIAELSLNQKVQEKLRKEICEKSIDGLNYENINQMNYLNQVLNGKKKLFFAYFI